MFNIGGGEILVVLLIAMVVLGPERLPKAARDIGRAIAEFRRITSGVQSDLRDAMGAEEFRESMESLRSVVDLKSSIKGELQGLTSSLTSSVAGVSSIASGATTGESTDADSADTESGGDDDGWVSTTTASFDHSLPEVPVPADPPVEEFTGLVTPDVPPPDGMFVGDTLPSSSGDLSVPPPSSGFDDVHPAARAADTRPRLGVLDSYDRA